MVFGIFSSIKSLFSDEKDVKENHQPTLKATSNTQPTSNQQTLGQRQARHRQDALAFVKQNHQEVKRQKNKEDAWERSFAKQKSKELNQLTGQEFEAFLAGLYRKLGYNVEMTPVSGDYGADLISVSYTHLTLPTKA